MRPALLARPTTVLRAATASRRAQQEASGTAPAHPVRTPRRPLDVLFVAAVSVLLAVHLVIFVATLVLAPVTAAEARSLALLQLPVEVARALVLPFHALLLGCLFVLGTRTAGRWAGFGAMLAVLSLDLRADAAAPIYGPAVATGGWVAAALLAAGFVLLPRRRLAAAAVVGVASGFAAVCLLALPAFLLAIAVAGPGGRRGRARALLSFTGVWALAAAAMQVVWLARLGADGWLGRVAAYTAELSPHALVPILEQQRILFAAWHFPAPLTFCLAMFLFLVAGIGAVRYFHEPRPGEQGPGRVLRRFPVEMWAAVGFLVLSAIWWALSGDTVLIDPNLPALAAIAPLITAMAYRGAKWLLTVNRFWKAAAIVYLSGLILARSTQLVLTLVTTLQT